MRPIARTIAVMMMVVLVLNTDVMAAVAGNQVLAEGIADAILASSKQDELVELLELIEIIDEADDFIEVFDLAFSDLLGSESDVPVGDLITLLYKEIGASNITDKDKMVNALLKATSDDRSLVDDLGMTQEEVAQGISKLDRMLIYISNDFIEVALDGNKSVFTTDASYNELTIVEARVEGAIEKAKLLSNVSMPDVDSAVASLKGLTELYSNMTDREKNAVFNYLNDYGFIEVIDAEKMVRDTSGFTDLDSVPWAEDAINSMYQYNVINGKSATEFDPDGNITRAEYAALLVRLLSLSATGENNFADATESDWFWQYVNICADNNYVNGVGNNVFAPNDSITREQVMTVIGRVLSDKGVAALSEEEVEEILNGVSDGESISTWAREGVALCVKYGIEISAESATDGAVTNVFAQRESTRAEVAQMLYRITAFVETIVVAEELSE